MMNYINKKLNDKTEPGDPGSPVSDSVRSMDPGRKTF